MKKILTLPLLSLILVTTACTNQSKISPNVIPISTESIYYANEAAKLSNSVKALQEWGSLVVGGDKELN